MDSIECAGKGAQNQNMENIKSRTSDAGPDTQETPKDWEDLNWESYDMLKDARHITGDNADRKYRLLVERAIELLQESITLRGGK